MAGLLEETIEDWTKTPFHWGAGKVGADCGISVLEYCQRISCQKVKVQPTHRSKFTAALLAGLNGGIVRYAGKLVSELGFVEVSGKPMRGDVGVIDIDGMGKTCCICLGAKWMAKGDKEILLADGKVLKVWRFEECRKH